MDAGSHGRRRVLVLIEDEDELTMKRILSIDGGGMKGYLPAAILIDLERRMGRCCYEEFDAFCGTSIGGILAILLACGMPAREAIQFFTEDGPKIFRKRLGYYLGLFGPRYTAHVIEGILRTRLKGMAPRRPVMVTAFDLAGQRPYFFKFRPGVAETPQGAQLWQAARATSSAQVYFPAFPCFLRDGEHVFWDGGNVANNPAVCAYAECLRTGGASVSGGGVSRGTHETTGRRHGATEPIIILSLGCGSARGASRSEQLRAARKMVHTSAWRNGLATVATMFSAGSEDVDLQMTEFLGNRYVRIQPEVDTLPALDDASPDGLLALKDAGVNAVRAAAPALEGFIRRARLTPRMKDEG